MTWLGDGGEDDVLAFDTGPGNALIDDWMLGRTGRARDEDGRAGVAGRVHEDVVRFYLNHSYFAALPPKSLDRYDFKLDPALNLSAADGAATLTAFTAACVRASEAFLPGAPAAWIACGARVVGHLVGALRQPRCDPRVDGVGFDGA